MRCGGVVADNSTNRLFLIAKHGRIAKSTMQLQMAIFVHHGWRRELLPHFGLIFHRRLAHEDGELNCDTHCCLNNHSLTYNFNRLFEASFCDQFFLRLSLPIKKRVREGKEKSEKKNREKTPKCSNSLSPSNLSKELPPKNPPTGKNIILT